MKYPVILFLCLFLLTSAVLAQGENCPGNIVRVEAKPSNGFSYPYYIYIPNSITGPAEQSKVRSFLVIPNNTGKISDDLAFHEADVKRKLPRIGAYLDKLEIPVLMPVFPRPEREHRIYTHSLDRDTFVTDKKEFSRFDLQLIAMIKDARERLKSQKIQTEDKILMQGYSASGMFVNRFVFLHPKLVKAAAIGAPGGWAIAPASEYNGKKLTFPAGISDLKAVSGTRFDLKAVRKVPMFMILGAKDDNDAVPMGDAYDSKESELVISLFGKTPVERWPKTEELYRQHGLNAKFKLYPNTAHQTSKEMIDDTMAFIATYVNK